MDVLINYGLAWPTQFAHLQASEQTPIGLHPRLGEAIMSVTAIAIARQKGLNIVTPEARIHHALITHDEEAVFEALSRDDFIPQPIKHDADEFLQAILIHTFDLRALSAQDIANLSADVDGLRSLRVAIESEINTIPPIADQSRGEDARPPQQDDLRRNGRLRRTTQFGKASKQLPTCHSLNCRPSWTASSREVLRSPPYRWGLALPWPS